MKKFLASFLTTFFGGTFFVYLLFFVAGVRDWIVYLALLPILLSVSLFMEIVATLYQWFLFSLDKWGN